MKYWRTQPYPLLPTLPLSSRKDVPAVTWQQSHHRVDMDGEELWALHHWPNVTQKISNRKHKSNPHPPSAFPPAYAFPGLLVPKAIIYGINCHRTHWKMWPHQAGSRVFREKLNLELKLIEVSQDLTSLEETLPRLSVYSTKKVQHNMF